MLIGHIVALFTVFVWGVTFISTKILLQAFTPQEILFIRFCMGWLALCVFKPCMPRFTGAGNELYFAAAGFFGVALYFILENVALEYSLAAQVCVIVSTTPFFTALVDWLFFHGHKPLHQFYLGFACAMLGISLIVFNGAEFAIHPLGDLLALLAAIAWAFYSAFVKKLANLRLGSLITTRRIFFYGVLLMLPILPFTPCRFSFDAFLQPVYLGNFLFLGLAASALCFATWTFCVARLGAGRASAYIYLVPVVTVVCAAIILREPITVKMCCGMFLVIAGLILSETRFWKKTAKGKSA